MPSGGLYPSLNDFMGLQLTQESIKSHMPETGQVYIIFAYMLLYRKLLCYLLSIKKEQIISLTWHDRLQFDIDYSK